MKNQHLRVCVSVCVFMVKVLPNSPPQDILILATFTKSLSRGWTIWSFLIFAKPVHIPRCLFFLWMRRFWCHHGSVPNWCGFPARSAWPRPITPSLQQMALTRSWTTDQQLERLPVSFFPDHKVCVRISLVWLAWWWSLELVLFFWLHFCQLLLALASMETPVDGGFLLMARQSGKLLLCCKSLW